MLRSVTEALLFPPHLFDGGIQIPPRPEISPAFYYGGNTMQNEAKKTVNVCGGGYK